MPTEVQGAYCNQCPYSEISRLALSKTAPRQTTAIVTIPLLRTNVETSNPKNQDNATEVQAGLKQTLYDELTKGSSYANKITGRNPTSKNDSTCSAKQN